ncbi:MAG TPA: hypothetical protein EYQ84_05630, partial [Nitrospinaceae bacterium]|nr:hypothetical protein [Nitrospinaceae bacterium]
MNFLKKNRLIALLILPILILAIGVEKKVYAQEQETGGMAPVKQIKQIKIGPHPQYTRLILDIAGPVEYQVTANFVEKKIALVFNDTSVTPKVRSRKYRDKNLAAVGVQSNKNQTTLTLQLKNSNTRFFHHKNKSASQIILDLKGTTEPFLKTKIGKKKEKKKKSKPEKTKVAKMKGLSPDQVKEVILKDDEERKESGWEEYQKALKVYQDGKFANYTIEIDGEIDPETGETEKIEKNETGAIKLFRKYAKDYPDSPLLPNILYLLAESEFNLAWKQKYPNYEKALTAF